MVQVLHVFFDESESRRPHDAFVVAGCVSTAPMWNEFERRWSSRLCADGLSSFHATDLIAGRPPFDTLGEDRRRCLGRDLLSLVEEDEILACVAEGVPLAFYRRLSAQLDNDAKRAHREPYFFCFLSCMQHLISAQERGALPAGPIECWFERRDRKRDRRLITEYERVRNQFFRGKFGPIRPVAKNGPRAMRCEAADLVAHAMMTVVRSRLGSEQPISFSLQALSDLGKFWGGYLSEPRNFVKFVREAFHRPNDGVSFGVA